MDDKYTNTHDEHNTKSKVKRHNNSRGKGVSLTDSLLILSLLKRYTDNTNDNYLTAKELARGVDFLRKHTYETETGRNKVKKTDENYESTESNYRTRLNAILKLFEGDNENNAKKHLMHHYISFLVDGKVKKTKLDGKSYGYYFVPNGSIVYKAPGKNERKEVDGKNWLEQKISVDVTKYGREMYKLISLEPPSKF